MYVYEIIYFMKLNVGKTILGKYIPIPIEMHPFKQQVQKSAPPQSAHAITKLKCTEPM